MKLVAVIDVGKTHAKMLLVEAPTGTLQSRTECALRNRVSSVIRELDVDGLWEWILEQLRDAATRGDVQAIVPITHGAAAVFIDHDDRVLVAPDYEDSAYDSLRAEYAAQRDPFCETFSPDLPLGLNLGRQLHYIESRVPNVFRAARHILPYPQYWAWRLSGVAATEYTSLGCHTDLWRPRIGSYSAMVARRGWMSHFPARRQAQEVLGPVTAQVAHRTGLPLSTRVHCGMHDSNASFLCQLSERSPERSFASISSGTWTVIMAHRADLARLTESRDMLANVDAFGAPVPTARFMGGREYAAIAGADGTRIAPQLTDFKSVLDAEAWAIPGFCTAGGPFAAVSGQLINADSLALAERSALATAYCALMTELLLEWLGTEGEVAIDGPLSENLLYCQLLAELLPGRPVLRDGGRRGSARAGLILAGIRSAEAPEATPVAPVGIGRLAHYRAAWREQLPQ